MSWPHHPACTVPRRAAGFWQLGAFLALVLLRSAATASDFRFGRDTVGFANVRFEGRTFRKHKQDFIEGTIAAISSRGKVLKQGKNALFSGTFEPN